MPDGVAPIRSGALAEGCSAAPGRDLGPGALSSIVAGYEPGNELLVAWIDLGGSTRGTIVRVPGAPAP